MTIASRTVTLSAVVERTRWSAEDFVRLGKAMAEDGRVLKVTVVTRNGQDRLHSTDPECFIDPAFPSAIRSVELTADGTGVNSTFKVAVESPTFRDQDGDPAEVTVRGADRMAVSGLFRELESILNERGVPGARLVRFLHGPGGPFVVFVATAAATLALYWQAVTSLFGAGLKPGIPTTAFILGAGLALCFAVPLTGKAVRRLHQAFPYVEFTGRLEPSNRFRRAGLAWFAGFVLLPVLLNVFSSLVTGWLN